MERIRTVITAEWDGSTVRHVLRAHLHFSSRAITRLVRTEGGITRNGLPVRTVDLVRAGDELAVISSDLRAARAEIMPCDVPLPVIYEDAHLLVVSKPAGMTAHASNFLPETPTVAGALAAQRGADFIFHVVNRLDKGTTGLMVVAKSGYIHDRLRRVLHTDAFSREYRAVCVGTPEPPCGVVDAPIGRDETSTVARCVREDGLRAVTQYEVLREAGGFSLIRLLPRTGRTHQIRVHMAHLGCPLAGDWLYGTEDRALIARPALHACALTFTHPVTGETLHFTSPLPEDMARLV